MDGIQIVRAGRVGTAIPKAIAWHRRQPRFDLVIDQHHGIPWYAPWWCRTRCIAYIHEVLGPIWDAFYPWPRNEIGKFQERWTHWLYRRVPFWTVSESTRQDLMAHGVRDVTVLPNGTDTAALSELDPKPLHSPVRLVVVTRLAPNKRVDHAIRALKCLLDRSIPAQLAIVGGGDMESQLRQTARELGLHEQVHFHGPLAEQEKNEQLRHAHLLIHCSQREGWGLNVIEANAMGTPAAVYPVAGLVDSTVHNQTGVVVAAETPEAMADGIQNLLQRPEDYQRMRLNAWRRAQELQWDEVLPKACDWLEAQGKGACDKRP